MLKVGAAVFVKTPGYSPLKTRLAAGVGSRLAQAFYQDSWQAVAEVLLGVASQAAFCFKPHWAVAEPEAHASWTGFPVLAQGEGGLGARLSRVYNALLADHDIAVLLGADAPQISAGHIETAVDPGGSAWDFTLGPAADGGFWLLAGRKPIPEEMFTAVSYSTAATCLNLAHHLSSIGVVRYTHVITDLDELRDLPALFRDLAALPCRSPAQERLLQQILAAGFS